MKPSRSIFMIMRMPKEKDPVGRQIIVVITLWKAAKKLSQSPLRVAITSLLPASPKLVPRKNRPGIFLRGVIADVYSIL
ncbi:MAG: hypothetical protein PHR65_02845 [Syntrophomonadaceae bacterium]|nr:hypothetical protein [Syntrophomonadaceae bacterium]